MYPSADRPVWRKKRCVQITSVFPPLDAFVKRMRNGRNETDKLPHPGTSRHHRSQTEPAASTQQKHHSSRVNIRQFSPGAWVKAITLFWKMTSLFRHFSVTVLLFRNIKGRQKITSCKLETFAILATLTIDVGVAMARQRYE